MWRTRWGAAIADGAVLVMTCVLFLWANPLRSADLFHRPLPALDDPRIVVYKARRVLKVYDGSRLAKMYRVAVGGTAGDKVREGDHRTPEGDFYVCLKNPQSKYTLSLGLSYPNEEHARRGLRDGLITEAEANDILQALSACSQPNWYTKLGGEIMIHGAGSGRIGTAGCVGMDDDDIRELYPAIPLGAPVRILP